MVFKESAKLALARQAVNSSAEIAGAAKPVTFEIVHLFFLFLLCFDFLAHRLESENHFVQHNKQHYRKVLLSGFI